MTYDKKSKQKMKRKNDKIHVEGSQDITRESRKKAIKRMSEREMNTFIKIADKRAIDSEEKNDIEGLKRNIRRSETLRKVKSKLLNNE